MSEATKDSQSTTADRRRPWRAVALAMVVVAGWFSTMVIAVMAWVYVTQRQEPWMEPPAMVSMRQDLAASPTDESLKQDIRAYDQVLREQFFQRQRLLNGGRWVLATGLGVTLASALAYAALRPGATATKPGAQLDPTMAARRNGLAMMVVSVVMIVVLGGVAFFGYTSEGGTTETAAMPKERTWPMFRGPDGTGAAAAGEWPTQWDGSTGQGIVWTCEIPGEGNSSPCIWGDRIFLTSADAKERWVHCIDATKGELLWSKEVKSPAAGEELEVFADTGFASPTPATDGRYVFVTFANADIACLDFDGREIWVQNLGEPDSMYGLASSPVVYENVVILQHDQGASAEDEKSELVAFEKGSGRVVWSTPRPVPGSWSSPIIIRPTGVDGPAQVITCGDPYVIAYDPATGKEIWRVKGLSGDVAPSPVFAGGLVFVTNTGAKVMAIRPDGTGNVTETHVVWTGDEGLPDLVSPIANEKYYLQVMSYGPVVCYGAGDGKLLWEHDFETQFKPSPVLAGDRVYLVTERGDVLIFNLADQFTLSGTAKMGEHVAASPAMVEGRIYIRGKKHLFCIDGKSNSSPVSAADEPAASAEGEATSSEESE